MQSDAFAKFVMGLATHQTGSREHFGRMRAGARPLAQPNSCNDSCVSGAVKAEVQTAGHKLRRDALGDFYAGSALQ